MGLSEQIVPRGDLSGELPMLAALPTHFSISRFTMNSSPEPTVNELRIARAYVKLSSVPEDSSQASVSLAWIGNCEIRMFRRPETDFDSVALF